jgi:hypothetical protein
MTAFHPKVRMKLCENIQALHERRKTVGRLTMTHDEYMATFVPSELRAAFRTVTPHAEVASMMNGIRWHEPDGTVTKCYITRDTHDRRAPPPMRDHFVQPDAPIEVIERVNHWLARGGNTSRDFGRVLALLCKFDDNYTRREIRFYWPSILTLLGMHKETKQLAEELHSVRTPPSLKPLPPGLHRACRLTAETIATATLIPEDAQAAALGEVNMFAENWEKYEEPDLGEFNGLG